MTLKRYEAAFERINYCDLTSYAPLWNRSVVVLGVAVWSWLVLPPTSFFGRVRKGSTDYYVIPHPSGLNRLYNDETYRDRARRLLRQLDKEYRS